MNNSTSSEKSNPYNELVAHRCNGTHKVIKPYPSVLCSGCRESHYDDSNHFSVRQLCNLIESMESKIANNPISTLKCSICNGTESVDSGGTDAKGTFIDASIKELLETNTRLNRRCQELERVNASLHRVVEHSTKKVIHATDRLYEAVHYKREYNKQFHRWYHKNCLWCRFSQWLRFKWKNFMLKRKYWH